MRSARRRSTSRTLHSSRASSHTSRCSHPLGGGRRTAAACWSTPLDTSYTHKIVAVIAACVKCTGGAAATRLRSSCACFRSLPSSLLPQPPHSHSRAKRWRRGNDECCSWSDAARRSSARAKRAHACRSRRGHARDILVRLLCIRVHACLT